MKKALITLTFATMFITTLLFANGKMNKNHLNMKGKDDAKINCVYCHKTAKIPKKKGQDHTKHDSDPYCMGKGCHPLPPKK
jgi:hypothetical protein